VKIEIKVPEAGESVTEAMISEWFVEDGDTIAKDDPLLEFETDKANQTDYAEEGGTVSIDVEAGEVVKVGQVVGHIDTEGGESESKPEKASSDETEEPSAEKEEQATETKRDDKKRDGNKSLSPAVRRIVDEEDLDPDEIEGSGKDGRILKEDALAAAKAKKKADKPAEPKRKQATEEPTGKVVDIHLAKTDRDQSGGERVVPMSMMRRRIAQRLVEAQQTAAILTTFNEIDMSAVMAIRSRYKERFEKTHDVRLGFMSFFVKACIEALKTVPEINAEVDGNNTIYRDYYNVGVAVGSEKGLVVPVIRDADRLTFSEIEKTINAYAAKARANKIALEDLSGGTFTISNGGIYGSLLSTPILNPPQSGILGMHKIEKRPVVVDDEVVVRPMMYVALSYDHRIVDGKGAVTFLVKVKECLEDPARMLLEV